VEARLGFLAVQEAVVPVQQVLVVDVPIVVMHAVGALDVNISSTQPWVSECQSVCIPASWICQDESAGLGAQVKTGQPAVLARFTGAPCPKAPTPRSCVPLPCSHDVIIRSSRAALTGSIRGLSEMGGVAMRHCSSDQKAQSAPLTHHMM
jgi:hypothetical protein